MLKISNFEVMNWENAIRGARNPMNSWDKSDSFICKEEGGNYDQCKQQCSHISKCPVAGAEDYFVLGPNDHKLLINLAKAGSDHAKYKRQIFVSLDILAPLYWWKEFDTYKVGTVANSCSTMHKIHAKEFTLEDFSCEHLVRPVKNDLMRTIEMLNLCRAFFIKWDNIHDSDKEAFGFNEKKDAWWQMIQLLPTSYNQLRTVTVNYEVLTNIYRARKDHKLDEWHTLCDWIRELPYSELITLEEDTDNG